MSLYKTILSPINKTLNHVSVSPQHATSQAKLPQLTLSVNKEYQRNNNVMKSYSMISALNFMKTAYSYHSI
jgi:hypothetical protein